MDLGFTNTYVLLTCSKQNKNCSIKKFTERILQGSSKFKLGLRIPGSGLKSHKHQLIKSMEYKSLCPKMGNILDLNIQYSFNLLYTIKDNITFRSCKL